MISRIEVLALIQKLEHTKIKADNILNISYE
jgi:hypothetical protein